MLTDYTPPIPPRRKKGSTIYKLVRRVIAPPKHSHDREDARRRRQIEKRMLRGAGLDQNGGLIHGEV